MNWMMGGYLSSMLLIILLFAIGGGYAGVADYPDMTIRLRSYYSFIHQRFLLQRSRWQTNAPTG